MKTGLLLRGVVLVSILSATVDAQTNDRHRKIATASTEYQYVDEYVYVTGSNIPRKVTVRRCRGSKLG